MAEYEKRRKITFKLLNIEPLNPESGYPEMIEFTKPALSGLKDCVKE